MTQKFDTKQTRSRNSALCVRDYDCSDFVAKILLVYFARTIFSTFISCQQTMVTAMSFTNKLQIIPSI